MSIYYSIEEAINRPKIRREWGDSIVVGLENVCQFISNLISQYVEHKKRGCLLALDGYLGVDWECIVSKINESLRGKNLGAELLNIHSYLKTGSEIDRMIDPYLGRDSHFGYVFKSSFEQFFDSSKLEGLKKKLKVFRKKSSKKSTVMMCYGCGTAMAALRNSFDYVFYFDLTREELFNRSEKRPISLLGAREGSKPVHQFLRQFYYVDSQALDRQKRYVLRHMDWYVDSNLTDALKLVPKNDYERILSTVAQSPFKVKPLYYPVSWGGTWLKKLKQLPDSMVNSGQGFLVANENSIKIALDDISLEIPFQNLLWKEPIKILGNSTFKKFKGAFPLAYWYDDGIEGGHMAIQVHPNGAYMKRKFNEPMRQDESYYILHTGSGAKTYLGLKEETDIEKLYQAVCMSEKEGIPFDVDKYINSISTKPGDYFLIPAGTVHASGKNQAVLEIDWVITAYSPGYTFHIYDYLRPDLDGTLRPIHVTHAFNVLRRERKAKWVLKNLKQKPKLIGRGDTWAEFLIGRRKDMHYEVHRLEFTKSKRDETMGKFHALTLVEGDSVLVQSREEPDKLSKLDFPDTLIVPACLGKYEITNLGNKPCKIVKALVK